jgi:hypothetical protein
VRILKLVEKDIVLGDEKKIELVRDGMQLPKLCGRTTVTTTVDVGSENHSNQQ